MTGLNELRRGLRRRVIVAEDDAEMRRVVVDMLRAEGHEVHEVADGGQLLLELARSSRFNYDAVDLVISDVRMPVCSGIQALETIRGIRPRLPFLLLTAFGDELAHERALHLGATLLDKPVSVYSLREAVTAILDARR